MRWRGITYWHGVPYKDLLLLVGTDTVVLVEHVEELGAGLLEHGARAGLEVAKVREDALLKLFAMLDGYVGQAEAPQKRAHNVGAGDEELPLPVHARDRLAVQVEAAEHRARLPGSFAFAMSG